jgi:hypothetical protein
MPEGLSPRKVREARESPDPRDDAAVQPEMPVVRLAMEVRKRVPSEALVG